MSRFIRSSKDGRSSFYGSTEDLQEFLRLLASKRRDEERELALQRWQHYKLLRQAEAIRAAGSWTSVTGKQGEWKKSDYIKSLTAQVIDLRGATFRDICVGYADLRGVLFDSASFALEKMAWMALKGANLQNASLRGAILPGMQLMDADLRHANLEGADLTGADLTGANLAYANLRGAKLREAVLERANLVRANVEQAVFDRARVYGLAAWDLEGEPKSSKDLVVTPADKPAVTADDLRVAQFIYLLIGNPQIRNVLNTVTRKVVLLLGRFSPKRKKVLDSLRDALRSEDLVPVLFDFPGSEARDLTETVGLLARLSRFVIADLTEPASIPQELQAIAPDLRVPIRTIIAVGHEPYSMSKDLLKYPWMIRPIFRYQDKSHLLDNLRTEIIDVAERNRRKIDEERMKEGW